MRVRLPALLAAALLVTGAAPSDGASTRRWPTHANAYVAFSMKAGCHLNMIYDRDKLSIKLSFGQFPNDTVTAMFFANDAPLRRVSKASLMIGDVPIFQLKMHPSGDGTDSIGYLVAPLGSDVSYIRKMHDISATGMPLKIVTDDDYRLELPMEGLTDATQDFLNCRGLTP